MTGIYYLLHTSLVHVMVQGCLDDALSSHPVNIPDLEWQDIDASTDVVVAMEGFSIKKTSRKDQHDKHKGRPFRSHAEPGNADSMFAWLSKLLPGL